MEKVIQNIPIVLLLAVVSRSVVAGAQISDSLIIIALCGLHYLLNNLNYNKQSVQIQQELSALRADLEAHRKEIAEAKQYVSGVKMASNLAGKR